MIAPDHSCSWTRRRRCTLWRHHGRLVAAGLSRPLLEAAARHLGAPAPEHLRPLAERLGDGATLVLQSRPRERLLLASYHANDAGWWARRLAPAERIRV